MTSGGDRGMRLGRVPAADYGHEETYWLRQKLQAAITHLRDVEDYYRTRGGLPEGFNMIRADRARALYDQISADFLNGKVTEPTVLEAIRIERDHYRAAVEQIYQTGRGPHVEIARKALDGVG